MTYCVALRLDRGLVFMADTRTNAGVDNISTFRKMRSWVAPGDRFVTILSAGNLATTQSVVSLLDERSKAASERNPSIMEQPSMFQIARLVGDTLREVIGAHAEAGQKADAFKATLIIGGQVAPGPPRLFLVYPEGNFIEASEDTPFFQIGETKYGKPILVLGDPGQLPPIKGEGAFTRDAPDIMLTEIHRQAAESAIIRLATMAREGQPIGFGIYDDHVAKMRKGDITPEQALRGGQLICGLNATRLQLNNAMRAAAGFGGTCLPTGAAEKIICLKNQNAHGLINGMFLTLDDIIDEGSLYFSAVVHDEEGRLVGQPDRDGCPGRMRIYKGHFEDHVAYDRTRHDRDWVPMGKCHRLG